MLRYELRRLVKDLKLTALHVTHDQEEAMSISDRVVVMKKGRIIEAGTPIELYTRPKNIFTANFVGEANFLKGVITGFSGESAFIDLGNEIQLTAEKGKEAVGERIVIAFRPEFSILDIKRKINTLTGEISDVLYSGSIIRIRVKLENGEHVVAKKAVHDSEMIPKVGEILTLSVAPGDLLVYSYPKAGLSRELALE